MVRSRLSRRSMRFNRMRRSSSASSDAPGDSYLALESTADHRPVSVADAAFELELAQPGEP